MTDFQIFLLPEREYWSWVRACQDYVMVHGANLTTSRETAARYMAPRQVISFPLGQSLKPELGDFAQWMESNHSGVRLDPIEAESPRDLARALHARLEAEDRYGQRQKPFYLLWPTDYPIVTQRFGANPQIYTRFGMPGHEGLDIRALPNTNVYASADGIVYRVHRNPNNHAYGIHIRIRHQSGYRTVYGHLAQSLVETDEPVAAGQVIGKADSTGASTAAHLHFTLKQDGATARKETKYPKDVIDPTPFMVWPESSARKSATPKWLTPRAVLGMHLGSQSPHGAESFARGALSAFGAVKLDLGVSPDEVEALMASQPELWIVARLSAEKVKLSCSPAEFLEITMPRAERFYAMGIRDFEIHAQPNLQSEGWRRSWKDGHEFASWFSRVVSRIKEGLAEARFGFPGLSPGGDLSGWRQDDLRFLDEASSGVQIADWLGVNAIWSNEVEMRSLSGGRRHVEYRHHFPDKPLLVSEVFNSSLNLPTETRVRQYAEYHKGLRSEQGIAGAFLCDESLNRLILDEPTGAVQKVFEPLQSVALRP